MTDDIERVNLEIPNEYRFLIKRYKNSHITHKEKFYGFALWKVFNATKLRNMDIVKFNLNI